MFGLFKKKSKVEVLEAKYEKLLEEAYRLSKTDRRASDAKQEEAQIVLEEIENLKRKN